MPDRRLCWSNDPAKNTRTVCGRRKIVKEQKTLGSAAIPLTPGNRLVPEARVELARAQGPLDFESKFGVSPCFSVFTLIPKNPLQYKGKPRIGKHLEKRRYIIASVTQVLPKKHLEAEPLAPLLSFQPKHLCGKLLNGRGTLPLPYPLQDMPPLVTGARSVGAFFGTEFAPCE